MNEAELRVVKAGDETAQTRKQQDPASGIGLHSIKSVYRCVDLADFESTLVWSSSYLHQPSATMKQASTTLKNRKLCTTKSTVVDILDGFHRLLSSVRVQSTSLICFSIELQRQSFDGEN